MRRYIVDACKNREKTLRVIGTLVEYGAWPITIIYHSERYLDKLEYELIQDFGPTILESGRLLFLEDDDFSPVKNIDVIIDPEKMDKKKLEAILKSHK